MTAVREVDEGAVLTPRLRTTLRRSLFWIAIVGILALIALIGIVTSRSMGGADDPLGPDNEKPGGARALVQVLEREGVRVTPASGLDEARDAIDDPAEATVLVYDSGLALTPDEVSELADLADRLVILQPDTAVLAELAPGVEPAGYMGGSLDADCALPVAERAEELTADGPGMRADDADALTCFTDDDGASSLVRLDHDGVQVTLLGAADAFRNDRVLENGNAALALGLLGEGEELVWLLPVAQATPEAGPPPLPGWVLPVALTAFLTVIAAGFWQGRRFGPLIVENMPVVVRASETMRGRARLYQHSSARLHALDALRMGTLERLAVACGLSRLATVDEVVGSVSALTGRPVAELRHVLLDADPRSDADLVALSDALLTIEQAVAQATRPTP